MSDFPSQQQDKFVLRLPDGMRDQIKLAAEANNRSMNAEIVARLDFSFSGQSLDSKLDRLVEDRERADRRLDLLEKELSELLKIKNKE
jgi:hypothetical protein